jgi:hypothetical protein
VPPLIFAIKTNEILRILKFTFQTMYQAFEPDKVDAASPEAKEAIALGALTRFEAHVWAARNKKGTKRTDHTLEAATSYKHQCFGPFGVPASDAMHPALWNIVKSVSSVVSTLSTPVSSQD